MPTIVIPGRLKNKANRYRVKLNMGLWRLIGKTVMEWKIRNRGKPPWWASPDDQTKAYEEEVAYRVRIAERRSWLKNEPLELRIRLVNSKHDVDSTKAIQDGIQQSGRIKNDKQFRRIVIEHVTGDSERVELEIVEL
jgi:Holliday junction resolvase RusA-like endonuclease